MLAAGLVAPSWNIQQSTSSLNRGGGGEARCPSHGRHHASAGGTTFTNALLGVTASSEGSATVATTRDAAGGLVGLRSGTGRSYYLFDGLGSVAAVTDSNGAVTNSYAYHPYGVTTETTCRTAP